jgi:hypothetical protein
LPLLLCALFALPTFAQEERLSLYDGASVLFERAQLLKPREETNLHLAFQLAPLIMQEVCEPNSIPSPGLTATLSPSDGERAGVRGRIEIAPGRVFFQPGLVQLNGRDHVELTYWWFYDAAKKPAERRPPTRRGPDVRPLKRAGAETGAPIQGVRLTLNTNGLPVIYEVLGQRGGVTQIYVGESVEAAARAEFGPALPGRQHAVERSLDDAPEVVVPRVIDDPPAVMGPILYLRAGTHEVATLICRCMDSQAKTLAGQSFYELVPAGISSNTPDATRLEAANPRELPKDFLNQTNRLSRNLRLPAGF